MFREDLHRATYASVRTEGTLWDDTLSLSWDEPRLCGQAQAGAEGLCSESIGMALQAVSNSLAVIAGSFSLSTHHSPVGAAYL
jgi:hypothetical protein